MVVSDVIEKVRKKVSAPEESADGEKPEAQSKYVRKINQNRQLIALRKLKKPTSWQRRQIRVLATAVEEK